MIKVRDNIRSEIKFKIRDKIRVMFKLKGDVMTVHIDVCIRIYMNMFV
jgi:hypothetical protein